LYDETKHVVARWCDKATAGLVKEPLPVGALDALCRLSIAAAVVFKGKWADKYDKQGTDEAYPFGEAQDRYVFFFFAIILPFHVFESCEKKKKGSHLQKHSMREFDQFF
jgi:serine protease inhibitor